MEKNCGIYCWCNRVNGKRYVGQSTNLKKRYMRFVRWNSAYGNIHTNKPIDVDRQTYPDLKYWEYTILEYCSNEHLSERELYWMDYYNTTNTECGYNIRRLARTLTTNLKHRISVAQKGRPLTEKHRKSLGRPVRQYAKDGTFMRLWDSVEDVRKTLGINHIGKACKGQIQSAGGFLWRYDGDNTTIGKYNPKTNAKPILQCDKGGGVIQKWVSAREAGCILNISDAAITSVCRGQRRTYKGYVWKYENKCDRQPASKLKTYSVVQMDLDGRYMDFYPTLRQAYKKTDVAITSIKRACIGMYHTAGGFKWRFATAEEIAEHTTI